MSPVGPRVLERDEDFARKAVIANAGYGPLDASLIAGMPYPRRVDMEVPGLRVLEKAGRDPWREWIGLSPWCYPG